MTQSELADSIGLIQKRCSRCGQYREISRFACSSYTRDGMQSWCYECTNEYRKTNRTSQNAATKRWAIRFKEKNGISVGAAWSRKNPDKKRAYNATSNLVRTGKIIKPSECECCGSKEKIEMHHEDYSQPDKVWFLCRKCHLVLHDIYRKGDL